MGTCQHERVRSRMTKKLSLADLFARSIAHVDVSPGTVYLYPLRSSDLSSDDEGKFPEDRARSLLQRIASLHNKRTAEDERPPLTDEVLATLTDEDTTLIADALREALPRARVRAEGQQPDAPEEAKREEESGLAYRIASCGRESLTTSRACVKSGSGPRGSQVPLARHSQISVAPLTISQIRLGRPDAHTGIKPRKSIPRHRRPSRKRSAGTGQSERKSVSGPASACR